MGGGLYNRRPLCYDRGMSTENKEFSRRFYTFMDRAYIRDGVTSHTGEALLIACLMHTKGAGRESKEMRDLRKIMKDRNLEAVKA